MTKLTTVLLRKDIAELKDAIHEIYLEGGDMTSEGNKEIDRLDESIRELEDILKEVK